MWLDLFIVSITSVIGNIFFGHFNTIFPIHQRLRKITLLLLITAGLSYFAGHWSLLFVVTAVGGGATYHWWWCTKYGINPISAEPRDKFEALVREQWKLTT